MTAIGPGDWVECVDNAPRSFNVNKRQIEALKFLKLGKIYVVRGFAPFAGILLAEIKAGDEDFGFGWAEERFRPIYRPKADLIERLMQPVPDEPVKAKA